MNELLEILEDIRPNADFKTCTDLIDGGYLDSFDILSIVNESNDTFGVKISPVDIVPDDFDSTDALWRVVQHLGDD